MRAGLRCGHSDRWIALDVTRSAFLNGPDNYAARLLSPESPTPRARSYADRLSENSREVTLVTSTQGTNTKKMAVPMTAAALRMDTIRSLLISNHIALISQSGHSRRFGPTIATSGLPR